MMLSEKRAAKTNKQMMEFTRVVSLKPLFKPLQQLHQLVLQLITSWKWLWTLTKKRSLMSPVLGSDISLSTTGGRRTTSSLLSGKESFARTTTRSSCPGSLQLLSWLSEPC